LGNVDFTVNEPKFKLKCVAYKPGELSLPFVGRVFRLDPDGEGKRYALELQRRSGDVLYFSELWALTKRYFLAKGMVETRSGAKGSPMPAALPLLARSLPQLDVEVSEEQIQSTVKCLLQMASSECADVKSQAIAALAKMSIADPKTQQLMVSEGCVEALLGALASSLEDVHRCAASALANLGHKRAPVCAAIAKQGGVRSLCDLVSTSETTQVHRECSRALRSIAIAVGVSIVDQALRQTVQTLSGSRDAFVRQQANHLLELLQL